MPLRKPWDRLGYAFSRPIAVSRVELTAVICQLMRMSNGYETFAQDALHIVRIKYGITFARDDPRFKRLMYGVDNIDALMVKLEKLASFVSGCSRVLLMREPDAAFVAEYLQHADENIIRVLILNSPEARRYLADNFTANGITQFPDTDIVFDHVFKTAGTALSEALRVFYPIEIITPPLSPDRLNEPSIKLFNRFPIVAGHLGGEARRLFASPSRAALTVLRDPGRRVGSVYTYWKEFLPGHPDYHASHIVAARNLTFSDFIRSSEPEIVVQLNNFQFAALSGTPACAVKDQAAGLEAGERLMTEFADVGLTEDLPAFLRRVATRLGVKTDYDAETLLGSVYSRRSATRLEISAEDAAYLKAHNLIDQHMYDLAAARHPRPAPAPAETPAKAPARSRKAKAVTTT